MKTANMEILRCKYTIIWKQRQDLRIWNIVFTVANLN